MKSMTIALALLAGLSVTACGTDAGRSAGAVADESGDVPDGTRDDPFVGHGIVREVEDEPRRLVIEHGDIPGFMAAMTMAFPVAHDVSLETVQAGDEVRFEVEILDAGGYQIFTVTRPEGARAP